MNQWKLELRSITVLRAENPHALALGECQNLKRNINEKWKRIAQIISVLVIFRLSSRFLPVPTTFLMNLKVNSSLISNELRGFKQVPLVFL